MEQGMEESDIEGLATHGGPESCVRARKGEGEALAGDVQAGPWSRESNRIGVPTQSKHAEGNITVGASREPSVDPARSENRACTEVPCARTGRAHRSPAYRS